MKITTVIIIVLLLVIIALLLFLIINKSKHNENQTGIVPSQIKQGDNNSALADVTEIVLGNALGQELIFSRPNELAERKYREVTINKAGSLAQHVGGAVVPGVEKTFTLNQLKEAAPNGLFTSQIPKAELSTYNRDGSFSSVQYSSHGTKSHKGFLEVDESKLGNLGPASVANVAMQGMAAVSGQYYLKQITDSLGRIEKGVNQLITETRYADIGDLAWCRNELQSITQKGYCDFVDINQIRNIESKAGKILEKYKLIYEDAYNDVITFSYRGAITKTALEEYNELVVKMQEILHICMIADRIIDEAKLAEIVARGKFNIKDPAINELYLEMEERAQIGFNSIIRSDVHGTFDSILEKADGIARKSIEGSIFSDDAHRKKRLETVKDNVKSLKRDIVDITDSVYGKKEKSDNVDMLLMLDDVTNETRVFVAEE